MRYTGYCYKNGVRQKKKLNIHEIIISLRFQAAKDAERNSSPRRELPCNADNHRSYKQKHLTLIPKWEKFPVEV